VTLEEMTPGQTTTVLSGHANGDRCTVVRVDCLSGE
jgi:hypothetical protein